MARKRPWAGMEVAQIMTAVVSNTRLKIPSDCDPVFRRLMKQCWKHNSSYRPSFDKIVIELSSYYDTLKRIQEDNDSAVELSEDSEEGGLLQMILLSCAWNVSSRWHGRFYR